MEEVVVTATVPPSEEPAWQEPGFVMEEVVATVSLDLLGRPFLDRVVRYRVLRALAHNRIQRAIMIGAVSTSAP